MGHLRVRDLGKAYKRYPHKWGRAIEWIGLGPQHELNWVLRNVSFDVAAGEAVGIIGANGAGKSTLLKLLAGTIRPTSGAFETGGRLAALLELGIGFHLEYSGRDNVRMAAHILGIPGNRIDAIIEEVEHFAEIGDYIDQPVRTYSSGMQVRLAFSVATAVRPEILIVDEALSVGDAYFQHKSFDRIRRFRDLGTTLLFVSHSPGAVKTLCDRAMLLDRGQILRDDTPDAVLDYYNAMIAAQRADYEIRQHEVATGHKVTRSGNRDVTIEEIELFVDRCATRSITSGDPLIVRIALEVRNPVADLTAGILIRDRFGNDIFGSNTFHLGMNRKGVAAGERLVVEFSIDALDLGAGSYSLTAALHSFDAHTASNFDWWDRAVVFQVIRRPGPLTIGVSALEIAARWCPPNEAVDSRVPETTTLVREKLGNEN